MPIFDHVSDHNIGPPTSSIWGANLVHVYCLDVCVKAATKIIHNLLRRNFCFVTVTFEMQLLSEGKQIDPIGPKAIQKFKKNSF